MDRQGHNRRRADAPRGAAPAPRRRGRRVATRNLAVATAVAVTLAGRVEFASFAATHFLTEIPLMLCAIGVYRRWRPVRGAPGWNSPVRLYRRPRKGLLDGSWQFPEAQPVK